jgi:hypothetical protein
MADGIPGAKGNPHFLGGGAPATAGDPNDVSDWAASQIDASVAVFGDLSTLPYTWVGMKRHVIADGADYELTNAGWKLLAAALVAGTITPTPTPIAYTLGAGSQVTKRSNLVTVRFLVVKSSGTIANGEVIANLPVGFRPSSTVYFGGAIFGTGAPIAFSVGSDGNIAALVGASTGLTTAAGSGTWEAA